MEFDRISWLWLGFRHTSFDGTRTTRYKELLLPFTFPLRYPLTHSSTVPAGLILSNYYSQEVCTPARASLLTGRYPLSLGMQYGVVDTKVSCAPPHTPFHTPHLLTPLTYPFSCSQTPSDIHTLWYVYTFMPFYIPFYITSDNTPLFTSPSPPTLTPTPTYIRFPGA